MKEKKTFEEKPTTEFQDIQYYSHKGKREYQEDAYDYSIDYLLVADGVGGHAKGDVASKIVVAHTTEFIENGLPDIENIESWTQDLMQHLTDALNSYAENYNESHGMGSTLVLALIVQGYLVVIHVGDSRFYLFSENGEIKFNTKDHSLVQELLNAKIINEEQAANHPRKNVITKVLQAKDKPAPQATISVLNNFSKGDKLLLCSDGVTESWTNSGLVGIFANANLSNTEIISELKKYAVENSGDNNTAIIASTSWDGFALPPFTIPSSSKEEKTENTAEKSEEAKAPQTSKTTANKYRYYIFLCFFFLTVAAIYWGPGFFQQDPNEKPGITKIDESREIEEAARQADARAWAQAQRTNTKASYNAYLHDYPSGRYAAQARTKIQEIESREKEESAQQAEERAWNEAKNNNIKESYNTYLENYPNGQYAAQARSKIQEIERKEQEEVTQQAEEQEEEIQQAEEQEDVTQQAEQQRQDQTPAQKAAAEIAATMVRIPGGTFTMGCTAEQESDCFDWEKPAHQVTVSSFAINKYEVTQGQWEAIMGSNPSHFTGCDRCPVESVSWNDVQEFIRKLNNLTGRNYRLPTEAEWEYAARGGQRLKYTGSNNLGSVGWYDGNSGKRTHPVGSKSPNGYGLYDMSGNVWEWCSDWYGSYSGGSYTNPRGPSTGSNRVNRGGSWNNNAQNCRVSNRNNNSPENRNNNIGFRLAL